MARVELNSIKNTYGSVQAVKNADVAFEEGTFTTLLGPSGCGKTASLRMISGLEAPTSGDILVAGKRVNDVPIHQRDLGLVFQNYALFPHRTIGQNIAFGLKYRKVSKSDAAVKVKEALDIVHLPGVEDRYVPFGAIVARNDLVDAVLDKGGYVHGFTYVGNPLACVAGLAVIEEIQRHDLTGNAERMGAVLKSRLSELMNRYPFIGDVRGKGLLLAFELVSDRICMAPLPNGVKAHSRLVDIAYDNGLIIHSRRTRGGNDGEHFLVCPPMIITEDGIDEIMTGLTAALDTFAAEAGLDRGGSA